ncbi:MAG: hypothetical protein KQ78_01952 [Candidatus Izimaplasma bacterium HR2]|nr:MAG: hypothetical protein KQ78_01952 [Candidatus Izimaplasma bacterium HR2]
MELIIVATLINGQEQFMINLETDKILRFKDIEEAVQFIHLVGKVPMEEIQENFLFYGIKEEELDKEEANM